MDPKVLIVFMGKSGVWFRKEANSGVMQYRGTSIMRNTHLLGP